MTGFPAARGSQGPATRPQARKRSSFALAWLQPWKLPRALLHLNEVEPGAGGFVSLSAPPDSKKMSLGKNGNTPVWSLFRLCYLAFAKIV
jgi:hypothetical protein